MAAGVADIAPDAANTVFSRSGTDVRFRRAVLDSVTDKRQSRQIEQDISREMT